MLEPTDRWRDAANLITALPPKNILIQLLRKKIPPLCVFQQPDDVSDLPPSERPPKDLLYAEPPMVLIGLADQASAQLPPGNFGIEHDAHILLRITAIAVHCFNLPHEEIEEWLLEGNEIELRDGMINILLRTAREQPDRLSCFTTSKKAQKTDAKGRTRFQAIQAVHAYMHVHNVNASKACAECEVHRNTWNAYLKKPTLEELSMGHPHPKKEQL